MALVCVLLAGASAATILARESVPAAGPGFALAQIEGPVTNRQGKADKLIAASMNSYARASVEETAAAQEQFQEVAADDRAATQQKPVQLAYASADASDLASGAASDSSADGALSAAVTKLPAVIATAPKPKVAAKPAAPKPPALLSDAQITQLRGRLNLSSSQEYYWPSVEQALRAIGRKLHATRNVADAGPPPIDPDSAEVQQLKYAAMPLLFQLREDQKQEVRKLARAMGLEQVAQQI
jgi:hypothetical protein